MSAEQSKLSFEPSPRLTCVSRAGSPSLLSARSPASPAGSSERVAARSFQGCSSSPVAVLWMGAKGGKDRSYLAPRSSGSPFELHRRKCVARDSGPGPFSCHLLVQLHRP